MQALPGTPAAAGEVFGAALPLAERYAALLAGEGVLRGLIGPAEAGRIWDRHLLNCAVAAELIPAACHVVDLGSGAGLPGLVLALVLPKARFTLVEPLARRTAFLEECAEVLGLTNVSVRRGRAEDLAGQLAADVVTARAVAPLSRLAGLAVGLARAGGTVLAFKGAGATTEMAAARPVLRRLGATEPELVTAGAGVLEAPVTIVRFRAGSGSGRGPARPAPAGSRAAGFAVRPDGQAGARRGRSPGRRGGSRGRTG